MNHPASLPAPAPIYSSSQLDTHKLQCMPKEESKITKGKRGIKNPGGDSFLLSDKKTMPKRVLQAKDSQSGLKSGMEYSQMLANQNMAPLFKQLLHNQQAGKQAEGKKKEQEENRLQPLMEESTRGTYQEQRPAVQRALGQTLPELSKETEDLVNSLLGGCGQAPVQSGSSLDQKILHIQSGASMREKYGDLTLDQLPLPFQYARLAKCQELADNMLVTFANRGKARFFSNLSDALEQSCRTHLKTQQLRQCLALQPSLYLLSYERNHERGGFYDLYISLPENTHPSLRAMLLHRKQAFRESLLQRAKHFHRQFLESKGEETDFDYSANSWHPDFDVHSLQELPLGELPQKPVQIKDFLSKVRHETEHPRPQEKGLGGLIEERTNRKSLSERTQEFMRKYSNMKKEAAKGVEVFDRKTGLSLELTRRIQEKEERLKEEREQKAGGGESEWRHKKKELKGVAELVNHTFLKRNVSNMFLVTLVEVLWETKHSLVLSKDDLLRLLDTLQDHFNHWIKYVPNKNGRIVRLDRTADFTQLLRDIDAL